jgi:hypothetical protein
LKFFSGIFADFCSIQGIQELIISERLLKHLVGIFGGEVECYFQDLFQGMQCETTKQQEFCCTPTTLDEQFFSLELRIGRQKNRTSLLRKFGFILVENEKAQNVTLTSLP